MIASWCGISAGTPVEVQPFEAGIRISQVSAFADRPNLTTDNSFGGELGIDVVYNFKKVPIGIGVTAGYFLIGRTEEYIEPIHTSDGGGYIGIVGEYNFNRGRYVNPYVSLGAGSCNSAYVRPAVGVELFYHLRVECGAQLSKRYESAFFVAAAIRFGGRPVKKKVIE